jgi:putrescine importer
MTQTSSQASQDKGPRLKRVLRLRDLIFYGIILIMPIAPIPIFGLMCQLSGGQAVTAVLIAMIAMMLTAVSYGRMAAIYPSAGSAYTYVGRGLNPHLGFFAGWAMFLDYLIQPLMNGIYGALTIQRLIPHVPYVFLTALFIGLMTYLNLRGIHATAQADFLLLLIMCGVITIFIVEAVRYLFHLHGWGGLFSTHPFYQPESFHINTLMTGTSLAALTYIGFDGVTTLAEEVEDPGRNVMRATVLVCLFTGLFGGLQVYLGQRIWPDFKTFPHIETAYMDVTRLVGGRTLFVGLGVVLLLAAFGAGLTGQAGAARLLYGMGRDKVIPRRFFGHIDSKSGIPSFNIWIIALIAFGGSLALSYADAAELLNFGAFLAFMGVNLATLRQFYFLRANNKNRNFIRDCILPATGFLFCFGIWWGLSRPAKVVGSVWLITGIAYLAVKTRGFRISPAPIDFSGQ